MTNQPPQGWNKKSGVVLPAKKSASRVDLNPKDFEKLLSEKGVRVRVYLTTFCPNVKSIDGAEHNIECPVCQNSGYIDRRPIETLAFIQNQELEKLIMIEGMVDGNSVAATFPAGIELQYFTLVELMDFTEPFQHRVKRQAGDVDVLKYRACRVNLLIDQNGTEYFQDSSFVINSDGNIKWVANKGPDPEVIYSIHYDAAVQFRATHAMHNNRFTQVFVPENGGGALHTKLPEQWALTKVFLVLRKDSQGNEILPNKIHPATDPDSPSDPDER